MENKPLSALNHLENGGSVLVIAPAVLSSVFYVERGCIYSTNAEIGPYRHESKSNIYLHFAEIIDQGGELVNIY